MNINLHVSSLYLIILLFLAILEKYAIRIKGYAIRLPLPSNEATNYNKDKTTSWRMD